jgi:acetylornithine deacetylase/succinyl-diaminopimelate desuccinylase-like protein
MGDIVGLPKSIIYKNPSLFRTFLLGQLSQSSASAAMLQSSITTLALAAASDTNEAPALAEAKIEVRLLPDEDPNAFLGDLRLTLSQDRIGVEVLQMDPPAVESSFGAPFFRALESAARQVFPQKVVAPTIYPSNTPASAFAFTGTPVLRLPAPSADNAVEELTTTVELRDSIELVFQTLYGAALLEEDPFDDLVAKRY